METGELVDVLKEAGFSPYQADAYVTLLELGSASARDIADVSGVPGPRIYDVLRDLEDEGYVTTFEQDRLYARLNDPDEALAGLRNRIDRFEAAIDEIGDRYQAPESEESHVSLVKRFRSVFARARNDIENAQRHVQIAATPEQFRNLRSALRDAFGRDVYVQLSLYAPPDEAFPVDHDEFEGVCTEVRQRELSDVFLVVTDRRTVCYSPRYHSPREYGVLVNDRVTAYVFHWYFRTCLWEVYEPVYDDRGDSPPIAFVEITECIQTVEPLLRDGATIHARVEGYSVRTGRERTLEGRIVDVDYTGHRPGDEAATLVQLAARAAIILEADGETYTVGGEGASVEDVSADRIIVEAIDRD